MYGRVSHVNKAMQIIEMTELDVSFSGDPDEYPCLANPDLDTTAGRYRFSFIYYDQAVQLVNSKEEQTK